MDTHYMCGRMESQQPNVKTPERAQSLKLIFFHIYLLNVLATRLPFNKISLNSRDLKVQVHSKLLISQSKFSGSRKFTLRYQ